MTASDDHTARIWRVATGALMAVLSGHTDAVWSASFSPDGTRIVTASRDHTARLWDARTGTALRTLAGHKRQVSSASFQSPTAHSWLPCPTTRPRASGAARPGSSWRASKAMPRRCGR